jgi:hypothetical protein
VRKASTTDPATWATWADALEAYSLLVDVPDPARGPVVGVGVVLTPATGITCVDLDRVLAGDQLDPRAARIVARCGSWAERSPSGTGVHVFVLGRVPAAIVGDQVEVYSAGRYIAVTGHQWPGSADDLQPAQGYLDALTALTRDEPRRPWTGPTTRPPDDLAGALLARLAGWGAPVARLKAWEDGYLVELIACPWADEHTSGPGGAAVMIRASGAYDFACQHQHCRARGWRDFRNLMEAARLAAPASISAPRRRPRPTASPPRPWRSASGPFWHKPSRRPTRSSSIS